MDKQGYLSAYKSVKNDILLFTRRDLYVCSPKDKQRYLSVIRVLKIIFYCWIVTERNYMYAETART